MATPYNLIPQIDSYIPEVIDPEYIDNYHVAYNNGNASSEPGYCYSVQDVSKYEYVLVPVCGGSQTAAWTASGLNATGIGAAFNERIVNIHKGLVNDELSCAWGLLLVDATHFMLVINTMMNFKMPFIGFIKKQ